MEKEIQISDAEVEVMKVLWADSPQTLPNIVTTVLKANAWQYVTVKTLLQRLVKKGAIMRCGERRNYLYSPTVAEKQYLASASRNFLARNFNASPTEMLAFLVKHGEISKDELTQIVEGIGDLKDE